MVWSLCCEIMSGAVVFFFVVFFEFKFFARWWFCGGVFMLWDYYSVVFFCWCIDF